MTLVTAQSGASTHAKSFEDSSWSKNGRNPFPVTELMSPFSDLQSTSPLTNVPSELSFMTQYGINGFIEEADIIIIYAHGNPRVSPWEEMHACRQAVLLSNK